MKKITQMVSELFEEEIDTSTLFQKKMNTKDKKIFDVMKEIISYRYTEKMPFNKFLGIEIVSAEKNEVVLKFPVRSELIGNYQEQILHGGVISAVIDLAGAAAVQINAILNMDGFSFTEIQDQFAKMSTIDMRIDFLKNAKGQNFYVKSNVVKAGNKISVAKSIFYDDENCKVAVGTASYMVG